MVLNFRDDLTSEKVSSDGEERDIDLKNKQDLNEQDPDPRVIYGQRGVVLRDDLETSEVSSPRVSRQALVRRRRRGPESLVTFNDPEWGRGDLVFETPTLDRHKNYVDPVRLRMGTDSWYSDLRPPSCLYLRLGILWYTPQWERAYEEGCVDPRGREGSRRVRKHP